ncbi:hypothetical protein [Roseivivax sp.]
MTDAPSFRFGPVSGGDMAQWCALLNDDNEIHLSREAAEAAGLGPLRINPGPANLAVLMNALLDGESESTLREVEARFLGNVREGDHLCARRDGDSAALYRAGEEAPLLTATFRFGDQE